MACFTFLSPVAMFGVRLFLYLSRHVMAVGLAAVIAALLWTVIYGALLLWAVLVGAGVGSPLSYPVMLLFLLAGILIVGFLIFAPACAVGRLITAWARLPSLAAIPFVFLAGGGLSLVVYWAYIESVTTHSLPPLSRVLMNYLIYLSLPLGAYWWLVDGPFAIMDGVRRWMLRRFYRSRKNQQTIPASAR